MNSADRWKIHTSLLIAFGTLFGCGSSGSTGAPEGEPDFGRFEASGVSAGLEFTCAVDGEGRVWCWGNNRLGALGDGTGVDRVTPAPIDGIPEAVQSVSAGDSHACALTESGRAWCWGWNGVGQLGNGTKADALEPVEVSDLGGPASQLVAGLSHTCALVAGEVKCWGDIRLDADDASSAHPQAVAGLPPGIEQVVAGSFFSCAVQGGSAWCWGLNETGSLGDGTMEDSEEEATEVIGIPGEITEVFASSGSFNACALLSGGDVYCWGSNSFGQFESTELMLPTPTKLTGLGMDVTDFALGLTHICALAGGSVWCWGTNDRGQLGDGSTENSLAPVAVAGLGDGAKHIVAGRLHSCAITQDALECWGYNNAGQLGDGSTEDRSAPVRVIGSFE